MSDPYLLYLERPTRERYTNFVLAYAARVERLVRRLVLSEDLAEDVIQETFLLLGRTRKAPREIQNPRAYVLKAAFNLAKHQARGARTRARHEERASHLRSKFHPPASEEAIAKESLRKLQDSIDALPAPLRGAMHLRAIEGFSYQEIAVVTGSSVSAVRVQVYRARKRLKTLLGKGRLALAFLVLRGLGPRRLMFEPAQRLSIPLKAGLPMALGIVCLCAAVLGFLITGAPHRSPVSGMAANTEIGLLETLLHREAVERPGDDRGRTGSGMRRAVMRRSGEEGLLGKALPRDSSPDPVPLQGRMLPLTRIEKGRDMRPPRTSLTPVLFALGLSSAASGAELGDINGDGRVSYADAYLYGQWLYQGNSAPIIPVEGSADFEAAFPCTSHGGSAMEILILEEGLRRVSPKPLPHFIEIWPPVVTQNPPPPEDKRVRFTISSFDADGLSQYVLVPLHLETEVELGGLNVVLRSDGIDLRPIAPPSVPFPDTNPFINPGSTLWWNTGNYVVSGGLLSFYTYPDSFRTIPPGEYDFRLPVEIPMGVPAGSYPIELGQGSEVVTPAGEVLQPAATSGALTLTDRSSVGVDLPFPPIQFAPDGERRIEGGFEARVSEASGHTGDEVDVVLSVRAGRPVNFADIYVHFESMSLLVEHVEPLYPVAATGLPADETYWIFNGNPLIGPEGWVEVGYVPERAFSDPYDQVRQPSLRYLSPLNEWHDLARLTVLIKDGARGTAPLAVEVTQAQFKPYLDRLRWYGFWEGADCNQSAGLWSYEPARVTPGKVVVLDPGEPPPPPPPHIDPRVAGIVVEIGNGEAAIGGESRLPVVLSTGVDLYQIRLVLSYEPDKLELVGFNAKYTDPAGAPGEKFLRVTDRPPVLLSMTCEGEYPHIVCKQGKPLLVFLRGDGNGDTVPSGAVVLDFMTAYYMKELDNPPDVLFWEAEKSYELGDLVFRVPETTPPDSVLQVSGTRVRWTPNVDAFVEVDSETAGFPPDVPREGRLDVPALKVVAGSIRVSGNSHRFLRADSDGNGEIEITDVILTFTALFLGGEKLPCADAADADDSGDLDISDSVYTLQYLFLGGPNPAPPFPDAGEDPTQDGLGCGGP